MPKISIWIIGAVLVIIGGIFYGMKSNPDSPRESLTIKGSDTEVQLVSTLAEAFLKNHPEGDISVTGGGSGTGIAALLNGEIGIANSSRALKDDEYKTAESQGIPIQEYILARDGLSVIINPKNNLKHLTLDQVGKIYRGDIRNWNRVGGNDAPIVLYGRQSTSGTYVFFRDAVLKSDYAKEMRNMEGNQAIIDAVRADKNGIGYVGVGYVKDASGKPRGDIGILNISASTGAPAISPLDKESVLSGKYPIFRPIYQYLGHLPAKGSLLEQFLRFESSPEGQKILEHTGFYELTAEDKAHNQNLLNSIDSTR